MIGLPIKSVSLDGGALCDFCGKLMGFEKNASRTCSYVSSRATSWVGGAEAWMGLAVARAARWRAKGRMAALNNIFQGLAKYN